MKAESKTPSMGKIEAKGSKIRRMEITPADSGGHMVTHYLKETPSHSSKNGMQMEYHEPETHVFGAEEGHEMLAQVANHLHVKEMHEEESDDKDNDDGVGADGEYD